MIECVQQHVLPAAFSLLPPPMTSPEASALLLAIGLQESRFLERRQRGRGPARGFWMFEPAGVAGVLEARHTAQPVLEAAASLRYPQLLELQPADVCALLEHNDVLAAVFARGLLWTSPAPLPGPREHEAAWRLYLALWRPGRPRRESWDSLYAEAWVRSDFKATIAPAVPAEGVTTT